MENKAGEQAPVVIIGYGVAGVNAIIALRNAGYTGAIQVLSDISTLPYSPILTSYYAWGEKTYEEFFPWSAEELAELDVEVFDDTRALELHPDTHIVHTARGDFAYSKCVIATGSTPQPNGFPSVVGYDPLMLRTMEDAERLKRALDDPSCKRVLVSGASMVALKTLEACLNCGKEVTLVGMNPHVLDFNAQPVAAERFEAGLRRYGVELRLGQTVSAVKRVEREPADGQAAGEDLRAWQLEVTFSNGEVDHFDEISVSHGMKSNLDFVLPDTLEIDRALLVDEFMRTSDPDVYAAGDVAQGLEIISGLKRVVGIWKGAAVQGACAGKAIAAELAGRVPDPADAYKGMLVANSIAVKDMLFISAGAVTMLPTRHVEVRETEEMTVVYIYEEGEDGQRRLAGYNVVCDKDEEGSPAYDTAAMLTLRIEAAFRQAQPCCDSIAAR